MSTFTLTKDGFRFKSATDQIKSITINDAANQIDFQQLSVATPFIENKEYVSPQEQVGEITRSKGGGGIAVDGIAVGGIAVDVITMP